MQMKIKYNIQLKDLKCLIYDNVTLYKSDSDSQGGYKDLFIGSVSDIPKELLDMKVAIIGAKRKNMLDIEVR